MAGLRGGGGVILPVNAVFCGSCGCPRNLWDNPQCPECGDWPFGLKPSPLYDGEAGWLSRQKAEVIQGELFEEQVAQ